MCLTALGRPFRTSEPLTVYKLFDMEGESLISPFRDVRYEIDKQKSVWYFGGEHRLPVFVKRGTEVFKGIHAHRTLDTAIGHQGRTVGRVLVACEVPAGTKCVYGANGDIAVLALTPKKILSRSVSESLVKLLEKRGTVI